MKLTASSLSPLQGQDNELSITISPTLIRLGPHLIGPQDPEMLPSLYNQRSSQYPSGAISILIGHSPFLLIIPKSGDQISPSHVPEPLSILFVFVFHLLIYLSLSFSVLIDPMLFIVWLCQQVTPLSLFHPFFYLFPIFFLITTPQCRSNFTLTLTP